MATDWLVLITPLPLLWKSVDTRRSRATQIGLVTLFSLGIVYVLQMWSGIELIVARTCCISIKRYVLLLNVDERDPTFNVTQSILWTMIEACTTICCAALPGSTYALSRILPLGAMSRAVNWVEQKLESFEQYRLTSRNPRVADVEENVPAARNQDVSEHPNNVRIHV